MFFNETTMLCAKRLGLKQWNTFMNYLICDSSSVNPYYSKLMLSLSTYYYVNSVSRWKSLIRFWPFFRHMYIHLSQNWDSDGHFKVLNINWFKSYGLKCGLRPHGKIASDKRPFYDHFWPFFCQLYVHLSQNWGSDSHYKVLSESKS